MSNALCWLSPEVIGFHPVPDNRNPLSSNQIRVKTLVTRLRHSPDLNPSFSARSQAFPHFLSSWGVAEVVEAGESVSDLTTGDRIYGPMLHADTQALDERRVIPLSRFSNRKEFSTFIDAGTAALQLVHASAIRFGDRVVVLGAGTIGLMALQYAWMSGAREIVAVDPLPSRLKVAQNLGAHRIVSQCPDRVDDVHAIIDCSGSREALHEAIQAAPSKCRVVAYADSYDPDSINEWKEWANRKGIVFQTIQDCYPSEEIQERVHYSIVNKFVVVWPIISHYVPFQESPTVCGRIQNEPDKYIQVLLTYENED